MNDKINVRSMAISSVDLISNREAFSSNIIKEKSKQISDSKDESLYRELVYGTTENLIYIDYMLKKLSKIPLKKLERQVLNALRLGLYELVFLRIENYATVNEYVKIIKRQKGIKAGNFVNAILRNAIRRLEEITAITVKNPIDYLSIKYSFNTELVKYLIDEYGRDKAEEIMDSLCQKPSLSIRVNTTKTSKDELKNLLLEKGMRTTDSQLANDSLIVEKPFRITDLDEFKEGFFTIQDQASIKVAEILNPEEGAEILDLCAAPGSKSSHLSQLTNDKSLVIANDISSNKLPKIKENFTRLGFKNYEITNFDASKRVDEFVREFDYILVDAPCSGLGVIRRKPEIKLFRTMDEIKELAKIQEKILEQSLLYLKNGGKLVYSTCTIGKLENSTIIDSLLSKDDSLSLLETEGEKYYEILPNIQDSDGFFIAKLSKDW